MRLAKIKMTHFAVAWVNPRRVTQVSANTRDEETCWVHFIGDEDGTLVDGSISLVVAEINAALRGDP